MLPAPYNYREMSAVKRRNKRLPKAEWLKLYSTYLEKVDHFEYKFVDITRFLTGMAERELGVAFSHSLPSWVVKLIIEFAGGRKRNKIDAAYWNVRPRFELPPTVLKKARRFSSREAKIAFQTRVRNPEKQKLALELFQKLTGETP